MQQIKFYLTKNIMYLLLILSIHTAYGSQSASQIFTIQGIKHHPPIENRPSYLTITCTTSDALD